MTIVEPKPYYNEDRILAKMPPALKPLVRKLDFTDLTLFYWVWGKLQRGLPLEKGAEKDEAQRIFFDTLLKHGNPERALRRMNELGVLSAFIPEFAPIVAMMQFNMYHSYTVDEQNCGPFRIYGGYRLVAGV